ncbi:MAG: phosphate ABC transporter substrate-binding protein PstS [Gammaproteobacteria bacterium]|nr:phosphate ABC transporter substrate-binding protein PstS [Gammaproteobacteria bacterium]
MQKFCLTQGLRTTMAAALIATAGTFGAGSVAVAKTINIMETGSTLLYPLFNLWVPVYHHIRSNVRINTQGTGSGTGIAEAISGVAQIGASDAYMSDMQVKQNPDILNIPLAISAQTINYNVPGLNNIHLKLNGPVLAGIYDGQIRDWNNPAIARLNPGVRLPAHTITPIHRTDGSGDTFIFSQYLSFSTPTWNDRVGYGTTISWPAVQGGLGAIGNPGMVQATSQTPYSIAYIGVSFTREVERAHLGTAMIENRAGQFLLPTPRTVEPAAQQLVAKTPRDERISLVFAPGKQSYPIINYEYAMVNARQADGATATALRDFLNWTVSLEGGNAPRFLKRVRFIALPPRISALSREQIAKIH